MVEALPPDDLAAALERRLSLREARRPTRLRRWKWLATALGRSSPPLTLPQCPFVDQPRLLFLHIEKSGGTSFDSFLSTFFRRSEVLPVDLQYDQQLGADSAEFPYRYLHLTSYLDRIRRDRPDAHVVTLLRDPVQRLVSNFWYLRQGSDLGFQVDSVAERMQPHYDAARRLTLPEWIRLSEEAPGAYHRNVYLAALTCGRTALRTMTGRQRNRLLRRARKVLRESLAFVGIVEDYSRSKRLFCRTFGLPEHFAAGEERCNAAGHSADRAELDAETTQLIRDQNAWDLELYEMARELFTARCREFEALPWDPLPAAERSSVLHPAQKSQGRWVLNSPNLRGSGLYREEASLDGGGHRWTGALPTATVPIVGRFPRGGTIECELTLVSVASEAAWSSLQLTLNDQPAMDVQRSYQPGRWTYACRFFGDDATAGQALHTLKIHSESTRAADPNDDRSLGVAIRDICLSCSPVEAASYRRSA